MCLDESSNHLSFQFPFATELWLWLGSRLNVVVDDTLIHVILACVPLQISLQVGNMFVAAIVHTLHTILMSRNTLRFKNDKASIHATKVKIDYFVTINGNNSYGCCLASNSPFLDSFSVSLHRRRIKEIMAVFWKPPSSPWLNVNMNDSVIGTNAACGRIFQHHLGPSLVVWAVTRCLIHNFWVIFM